MAFTPPDLAARRAVRAVHLRAMGHTYDYIAQALLPCPDHQPEGDLTCLALEAGCLPMFTHRSAARRAVQRALEDEYAAGAEGREQLRRQHLSQIDTLLVTAVADALGPLYEPDLDGITNGQVVQALVSAAAASGDRRYKAMTAAARLLDARAKVLGLYAPTRVQVTDELDAQIEDMLRQVEMGGAGGPAPVELGTHAQPTT